MSRHPALAFTLLLALALPFRPQAAADSGTTDPMSDYRLEEAILAMDRGEFERALDLALLVVMANDKDARAHREVGRAAHALGRFQIAIDHLERALALQGDQPDPEARYLLGEAYYAVNRRGDGARHHDQVRREVAAQTTNWMELLWLARIHARRKELAQADRIYLGLLERDPTSEEAKIARIEAYTLSQRWAEAEKQVREFIAGNPDHPRAQEILAWVLEAQKKFGEERELRARLAKDSTAEGTRLIVDHARALERSGQYGAAISKYEEALSRAGSSDAEVDEIEVRAAVSRLRYRLTTETAVAGGVLVDPSGSLQSLRAGVAVPVADPVTVALITSMDWSERDAVPGAMTTPGVTVGSLDASVIAGEGKVLAGAFTLTGSYFSFEDGGNSTRLGSSFDVRVGQGKPLQLHAVGKLRTPWREAASTMREGGRETGLTAMAYALPFGHRLIFDAGAVVRTMTLDPMYGIEASGSQRMLVGGADWVVWAPSMRSFRGQFLDDDLRWGTSYLADSLTLSYRHYESFTDDEFGGRLDLAERGTVDEVSAVARNTWPDGLFGFEARGGFGHDWARDTRLWRVGTALLLIPFERVRGSLSYDYANESAAAFTGSRHTGWASLHLDL